MNEFNRFKESHTCRETLKAFNEVKEKLGLENVPYDQFFDQLCFGLNDWKVKTLFEKLKKRISLAEYKESRSGNPPKVLIVGAGPCGLRLGIEATFLGCQVVLIEKRNSFTRNNVLHLWSFVVTDLKNIGINYFYNKFARGDLDHISIRRLQLCLLKIALILGVEVHTDVEFKGLKCPVGNAANGWKCVYNMPQHVVSEYEFEVLVAATGARDALCEYDLYNEKGKLSTRNGFDKKEFRGQLSIAITANFVNENSPDEMKAKEIGGVASHFNQKLFKDLKKEKKIHLENFVYYKDETHYFVMTAKKSSLLERGVFMDPCRENPDNLMLKTNINKQALLDYARDAANFCTKNAMPNIKFAMNSTGAEDVAMLDFSSRIESVNASRVIETNGTKLLICLVGDSLLEPFWPQGTGCARGFLGAMDTAWMIKNWDTSKGSPIKLISERESVYKLLSQTNQDNIKKKYSDYTVNPYSRYKSVNLKAVGAEKAKDYYDNIDLSCQLDQQEVDHYADLQPPTKKTKSDRDFTDLLSWCQTVLGGYFTIVDLTSSWRSGVELGLLLHLYRPTLIKLEELNANNPVQTMIIVVKAAEEELGISPIMSVTEMVNCSQKNEVEMASYLFQFYDLFCTELIPKIQSHINFNVTPDMQKDHRLIHPVTDDSSTSEICSICKKELLTLEKINVENMFCHRSCLKCDTCQNELNLKNYRLKKSRKGNVKVYCARHAKQGSIFASSIRKRIFPANRISNRVKPVGTDVAQAVPMEQTTEEPEDIPKLPDRPALLARRVTSSTIRRNDFYNSLDDNKVEEAEEKIFEHNFGASIRGYRGAFGMVPQEIEKTELTSDISSEDDNIEELVEAALGENIDKNMTIKDAKTLWQTLRRQTTVQHNVIKHLETTSQNSEQLHENNTEEDTQLKDQNFGHTIRNTETIIESSLEPIKDEEDILDGVQAEKRKRNSDLLEQRISKLNRESRELEDRRYKFSATCYRPAKKTDEEALASGKSSDTRHNSRPKLRRSDSDQTDVRHAQRVQLAARKMARQRQQKQLFMVQEIERQLQEADVKLCEVEQQGVEIEKALKEDKSTPESEKLRLRRMLCSLYSQRQTLLHYEAELRTAYDNLVVTQTGIDINGQDLSHKLINGESENDSSEEKDMDTQESRGDQLDRNIGLQIDVHTFPHTEQNGDDVPNGVKYKNPDVAPDILSYSFTNPTSTDDDDDVFDRTETTTLRFGYANCSQLEEEEETCLADDMHRIVLMEDNYWECAYCTLHNNEDDAACGACYAWRCSLCTYVNEVRRKKCEMCYSDRPPLDQRRSTTSRESFA